MLLTDEPVRYSFTPAAGAPGRRLRVFVRLVRCPTPRDTDAEAPYRLFAGNEFLFAHQHQLTYGEALCQAGQDRHAHEVLTRLQLRHNTIGGPAIVTSLEQITSVGSNPELPDVLQDLAEEVAIDVHEACAAFDDPDVWYPGVDEGIEPVPDQHVELVIAALQRELNRERRNAHGQNMEPKLPPAPLAQLPQRVQRALVERRRLRFAQYGIGREQWLSGTWSLWDVREDPDWVPRRA